MQLIIQGSDKRKAKGWIQFAKSKLQLIKSFTPPNMPISRNYRPVPDVSIHIKSVNGIDTIKIDTVGGKYMCDFEEIERWPIPHSDFEITCPNNPHGRDEFLNIGFASKTQSGSDWDTYEWDFGDGETDEGGAVSHDYAEPGEYTVTLTVKKEVIISLITGTQLGGDRKYGIDNTVLEPYARAQAGVAWANYQASAIGFFGNHFEWSLQATNRGDFVGLDFREVQTYSYLSQNASAIFNLTGVAENAVVTAYMNLLAKVQVCNTPAHLDPCSTDTGGLVAVTSSAGGSVTPYIGMPNPVNLGDISSSIGGSVVVEVAGAYAFYETPMPGTFPEPNRSEAHVNTLGILGTSLWAVAEEPLSSMKTAKVIKVYTGRRGNKRTRQIGESIHT